MILYAILLRTKHYPDEGQNQHYTYHINLYYTSLQNLGVPVYIHYTPEE